MLKKVFNIIPLEYRKKAIIQLIYSILNAFLDLLSIAYIIPLFIFILDKSKIPSIFEDILFFEKQDIKWWVIGIILLFILKNLFQSRIIKRQSKLVFNIATALSSKLALNYINESYAVHQNIDKGKKLQEIQMSGTDFSNFILLSLNSLFTEFLVVFILVSVSLILNATLTGYVILFGVICFLILYLLKHKRITSISNSIKSSYAATATQMLNILNGATEIKSLQKEVFFVEKFKKQLRKFNDNLAILKTLQNSNIKYLEIFLIIGLSLFVLLLNSQQDTFTNRVVLVSYLTAVSLKLFPSLNKITIAYTNIKSYKYTISVFENLTKEKTEEYRCFEETLALKNVSFGYVENELLLTKVNLTINKGDVINIKGRSGCGKTTLLNLIMGLLKPIDGNLFIDGNSVKKNASFFSFTNYIPQQPFIFHGSIIDNITLGENKKTTDYNKIEYLLKNLRLYELFNKLPEKLNTVVSHDTLKLSGGQKQRLTIARALYSNPQLLIMDEATNQLDEELEKEIIHFLYKHAKNNQTTVILASHSVLLEEKVNTFKISNGSLIALNNHAKK